MLRLSPNLENSTLNIKSRKSRAKNKKPSGTAGQSGTGNGGETDANRFSGIISPRQEIKIQEMQVPGTVGGKGAYAAEPKAFSFSCDGSHYTWSPPLYNNLPRLHRADQLFLAAAAAARWVPRFADRESRPPLILD